MPNSFSQIYFHLIIVVSGRLNLINHNWQEELYKYINGIVMHKKQKLICINGTSNHLYLLINTRTDCCISDLVRDLKANSSKFVNENEWALGKFHWQQGSGIFSVSHSQVEKVKAYILDQEVHHKTVLFEDEYREFIKAHNIPFKEEYLFD